MNHEVFVVLDWILFIMLVPATIILAWKIVGDKLKGKRISSNLINAALIVVPTALAWIIRNLAREAGWLQWALLAVSLIVLVFLFKVAWAPLKRDLKRQWYGED